MTVLLGFFVGFVAARLLWLLLRPVFSADVFVRQNYRGRKLPTAVGLVIALAVVAVEGLRALGSKALGDASWPGSPRLAVLVLVITLALLGLLDDLAGDGDQRGFRGHVRALVTGRLTTGAMKLLGGGAVALVAAALVRPDAGIAMWLADAALVALAANTGNLFDRAPGRAIKVGALAFAAVLATTGLAADLAAPAVVVGAAMALLLDDLHERLMLGDTGANLLGGVLGLAVVYSCSPATRVVVLVALAVLNVASEYLSFSRVIDGFAPLRILDRAGRRAA